MALFDDVVKFVWPNALVVVAVGVLAPVLLPAAGFGLRPLVKGAVKAGLTVKDMVVGFVEETGEQVSDLVAEAKAEHYARPDA